MSTASPALPDAFESVDPPLRRWRWLRKNPTLILGALLLVAVALLSIAAPWVATHDPQDIDPLARMQAASSEHYFGTDALGRDVFSRAVWGGRISLTVGLSVAVLASLGGLVAAVLGYVFLRERLSAVQYAGVGITCIAEALLAAG